MGKSYKGITKFVNPFLYTASLPIDDRSVVQSVSDLTTASSWDLGGVCTAYKGMLVAVADTGDTYVYIGTSGDPSTVTDLNNWKLVGKAPVLETGLKANYTIGGINKDYTFAANTPLETILLMMFSTYTGVTSTQPSLSISPTTITKLVGSTETISINCTFNRASIKGYLKDTTDTVTLYLCTTDDNNLSGGGYSTKLSLSSDGSKYTGSITFNSNGNEFVTFGSKRLEFTQNYTAYSATLYDSNNTPKEVKGDASKKSATLTVNSGYYTLIKNDNSEEYKSYITSPNYTHLVGVPLIKAGKELVVIHHPSLQVSFIDRLTGASADSAYIESSDTTTLADNTTNTVDGVSFETLKYKKTVYKADSDTYITQIKFTKYESGI